MDRRDHLAFPSEDREAGSTAAVASDIMGPLCTTGLPPFFFICTFQTWWVTVQDMLPPNMASWHAKYFNRNWRDCTRRKTDFPLEQVVRQSHERRPLQPLNGKETPYLQETERMRVPRLKQVPLLTTLSSYPFCLIIFFHDSPLFIKPKIKAHRFNFSLGLHFLMKALVSHKTYVAINLYAFLVNMSFVTETQLWTKGGRRKKIIF